ncbi:MAG: restriction endonuclease subunit R [Gammaproteobacteria bacterium]|nr:MAG: restriction endonuclease subunit R [Gammaproteobacteria bacterium]
MNLKEYQNRALKTVRAYLEQLVLWRTKAREGDEWLFDFSEKAWEKARIGRAFFKKEDGCKRPLPVFCLKIPTGGGKTLLAVKTIDLAHNLYRKRQTGLVVWITPTLQIYRQTMSALKDRDHPYRQHLDMVSAGRTLILEKSDAFTPQDENEHLCVLMLMLPSASRKNKEALRMFKDAGAFQHFFPSEDDLSAHAKLRERIPNLETFDKEGLAWGTQIKTSLGNTIRLLEPLIILDEGHKAYSETAQETLRNLNPCMIVELSATPPKTANILVSIGGQDLLEEEMVKLDLHIVNRSSTNWRDTLRASMQRRDGLEDMARDYEANTNIHIRPINLIQVERTGKEQRDGKLIHAEDVREYLLGQGVPKEWIAVKTSGTDELKDYDDIGGLLVRDCPVRYIITKQALQEGWDCAFAYVLTILTNPQSKTAMTQLVGRILRQPYARKTHIPALDESYVYCFQRTNLLDEIRAGFQREGMKEMQGRVVLDHEDVEPVETCFIKPRARFRKAAGNLVLPAFVIRDGKDWRLVHYEADILSRVRWPEVDVTPLFNLELSLEEKRDVELRKGFYDELAENGENYQAPPANGNKPLDFAYAAAHLLDVAPNPWVGHELVETIFNGLLKKWSGRDDGAAIVANNWVYILEETRKRLEQERDRLAEDAFNRMLEQDEMRFMVIASELQMKLPRQVEIPKGNFTRATRLNGNQFELNLFDPVPSDSLNTLEHEVASFLDEQSRLYFWYRNLPHSGYYVQGWQRGRIFADFIFTAVGDKKSDYRKVFIVETKGKHLMNADTKYKQSVFDVCNKHAKKTTWNELAPSMRDKEIDYEVLPEDEWQNRLNELMAL